MTLDEAIKDSETISEECQRVVDTGIVFGDVTIDMLYCDNAEEELAKYKQTAENYRQLAEWLKELKDYKERIPSYEAGYNDAKREIALSGEYERAYERGKADTQMARWIPVSEKLPNRDQWVLVTTEDYQKPVEIMCYQGVRIGRRDIGNGWEEYEYPSWTSGHGDVQGHHPKVWMPLPKVL